ncbi:hypothetical protein [Undibacterium sp. Ji50W]|uniref:hypothetical protein n=1 Tax=Undibacterium sp. Ji50W TaxID=3413041 RepID=UPI003BF46886
MILDRILTVNDYYDGPRLGVAELNGVPHIYQAEHDHRTEAHGEHFFLSPIRPDLLALVLEDWQIWLRWNAAYQRGEVSLETHPALPAERDRHEIIESLIGDQLKTDPINHAYYRAHFSYLSGEIYVEWVVSPRCD